MNVWRNSTSWAQNCIYCVFYSFFCFGVTEYILRSSRVLCIQGLFVQTVLFIIQHILKQCGIIVNDSFAACQVCNNHAPAHLDQQMLQFQYINNQHYWYFPTKRWSFSRMTVLRMTCSTLLVLQHISQYVHMDCDSKCLYWRHLLNLWLWLACYTCCLWKLFSLTSCGIAI